MARRVVSILRGPCGAARPSDPSLEANAYAIAEDVHLALVLRGSSVELAVARASASPVELAGVGLPPVAASQDLHGLIESGVEVYVDAASLHAHGLDPSALVRGVDVIGSDGLATLLREAEAVLGW